MKKQIILVSMMLLALAVPPAMANYEGGKCARSGHDCAQGSCSHGKESGCPIANKLMTKSEFYLKNADEIGLSEDQVKQIKAIKLEAEKDEVLGGAQMKVAFLDIESKMSTDPVDQESLNAVVDSLSAGMNQGAKKTIKLYADLKSVLTADQKKKAKTLWKK